MQADMDHLVGDGCLAENMESFLPPDDMDTREKVGKGMVNLIDEQTLCGLNFLT